MADCDLLGSCFFFNELVRVLPETTDFLCDKYCKGAYPNCAIYRISKYYGNDKVPKYLYPNDTYETFNFNYFEPHGGLGKLLKAISSDGRPLLVKSTNLCTMAKSGDIVAYQCPEGWVELRRKQAHPFQGSDRRHKRSY